MESKRVCILAEEEGEIKALPDYEEFDYELIKFANIKQEKCDLMFINNPKSKSFFRVGHNIIETTNMDIIVIGDFKMFMYLLKNYDEISDVKVDRVRYNHKGINVSRLHRFQRINGLKFYKEVIWFKNYYFVPDKDGEYTAIDGVKVKKEYDFFKHTDGHYEKDVRENLRYCVLKSIAGGFRVKHNFRISYFDIETNASVDTENTPGEILSIVSQDSMTKEVKKWIIDPDSKTLIEDEKKMLTEFLRYLRDFDVVTGWNVIKFDCPYTFNRAIKLGIDLSEVCLDGAYVNFKFMGKANIRPYYISIPGLNVVDMMQASVRALAYLDEKLKDKKLDTVAEAILGETKIHTDTPAILWKQRRLEELMAYNVQDVLLLMKIDNKLGITDLLVSTLEIIPGLNLEEANYNSKIIDFYLLSKFKVVMPSVNRDRVTNIKGAVVFDTKPGVHKNVAVMDIAGMYPNLIRTFNISPDTLTKKDENDMIKVTDDIKFSTSKEGILVKLVTDFQVLRTKYKKLKELNINSKDYELYKLREYATKKILSSVYGVFGFVGFRLFDNDIGNAITTTGRELLGYMADYAEQNNFIVVSGDTDSIFIKSKDSDYDTSKFGEFCDGLNASLHKFVRRFTTSEEYIKKHKLSIEYETLFTKIILPKVKKKYIGMVSIVKGKKLEKEKLYYKGSELNKKDVPSGLKEIIRGIVTEVLTCAEDADIIEIIKKRAKEAKTKIPLMSFSQLLIYKEITRNFDEYIVVPNHVRAAQSSNKYLGTSFSRQDYKGGLLYVKSATNDVDTLFISPAITIDDVRKAGFEVNYDKYFEKFIGNKVELIFGSGISGEVFRVNASLLGWIQ